jgi:hypothetical protein
MPDKPKAIGFLCYARADNGDSRITRLKDLLSEEVSALSGKDFPIYQDISDLGWGDPWREGIDASITRTTFLFAMITSRFFQRPECRRELELFLKFERMNGLEKKRVKPIYYNKCAELEDPGERANDALMVAIAERQRIDWCDLRLLGPGTDDVRKVVNQAADKVVRAIERLEETSPPPPPLPPLPPRKETQPSARTQRTTSAKPKRPKKKKTLDWLVQDLASQSVWASAG